MKTGYNIYNKVGAVAFELIKAGEHRLYKFYNLAMRSERKINRIVFPVIMTTRYRV